MFVFDSALIAAFNTLLEIIILSKKHLGQSNFSHEQGIVPMAKEKYLLMETEDKYTFTNNKYNCATSVLEQRANYRYSVVVSLEVAASTRPEGHTGAVPYTSRQRV